MRKLTNTGLTTRTSVSRSEADSSWNLFFKCVQDVEEKGDEQTRLVFAAFPGFCLSKETETEPEKRWCPKTSDHRGDEEEEEEEGSTVTL